MKLCNIFLTAAVFLSVGIVFAVAEETADGEIRGETAQAIDGQSAINDKDASPRSASASRDLPITLSQYRDSVKTDSGRTAYLAGAEYKYNGIKTALTQASSAYRTDEERQVYDFAVPFDNSVIKEIGFTERNDNSRVSGSDGSSASPRGAYQTSDNEAYSTILVFEKKILKDDFNRPQIMSGGFQGDNLKEEKKVAASPLSTPLMLLLFTFTFYILIVVATTVGIKIKE